MAENEGLDEAIQAGARQMRAVIDAGYDDETALYTALEAMNLMAPLKALTAYDEAISAISALTASPPPHNKRDGI